MFFYFIILINFTCYQRELEKKIDIKKVDPKKKVTFVEIKEAEEGKKNENC